MFVEAKPLPFFEVVPLRISFSTFRAKLINNRLEFSCQTVKTVVIDFLEPGPDRRRRNDRVKHLWPPGPSIWPFAGPGIHDCDVVEILVMVKVVSDGDARGNLLERP